MKLLKAYVRSFMASKVMDEIRAWKCCRVTAIDVKAFGDEIPHEQLKEISDELGSTYTAMVKIELVCEDECIDKVKEIILTTAKTGYKGDGIVVISPIEEVVNIRTGKNENKG